MECASRRRHREADGGALIRLRLDAHRSAVALHDSFGEVEAVAGAATARFVEFQAEVEDLRRVAGIDPDAVVADAEAVAVGIDAAIDGDRPLAFRPVVEKESIR